MQPEKLTRGELASEFVELLDEIPNDQMNEILAKNVPLETLEFFASYAEKFGLAQGVDDKARKALPNLLLLGYLLRLLEDRLLPDDIESYDA